MQNDIASPYFPRDEAGALRVLSAGPLSRPKESLLRNFVVSSLKEPLIGEGATDPKLRSRIFAALKAVRQMHRAAFAQILAATIPSISQQVPGDALGRLVRMLAALPEAWEHFPDDARARVEHFARLMPDEELNPCLFMALDHPALSDEAKHRLSNVQREALASLIAKTPIRAGEHREIIDRAMKLLEEAGSFNEANAVIHSVLRPLLPFLVSADVQTIVEHARSNGEVRGAWQTPAILRELRGLGLVTSEDLQAMLIEADLKGEFRQLFPDDDETDSEGEEPEENDFPF
jgi:hypothetical protein